jgi:autotransporter passenger strand-loop-strand repeat protein
MTSFVASSGQILPGVTLNSGDGLYVGSGGTAVGAVVNGGGIATVAIGGAASGTTVDSGGLLTDSGGESYATTVNEGGAEVTQYVAYETYGSSGRYPVYGTGMASGTTVDSGGVLVNRDIASAATVESGGVLIDAGTAVGTTVADGGTLIVLPGAVESCTTGAVVSQGIVLYRRGAAAIVFGAVASGVSVGGDGGELGQIVDTTLFVLAGGTAVGASIGSGGVQVVYSGGVASRTNVEAGGNLTMFGGSAGDIVVGSGGLLSMYDGVAIGTTLDGGAMDVTGQASGTRIYSGGYQSIGNGIAIDTIVGDGGTQDVFGSATSVTVQGGGRECVRGGAMAESVVIEGGGTQILSAPSWNASATASGTVVSFGAAALVGAGGLAIGATVRDGGEMIVSALGSASGTDVESGGALVVLPGGSASGTSGAVLSSGVLLGRAGSGIAVLANSVSGVAVAGDVLLGGVRSGTVLYALPGGTARGTLVASGGAQDVFAGGTVVGAVVTSGGAETVFSGATDSAPTLAAGGVETVNSGGTVAGATVDSGGQLVEPTGGVASGTIVNSGGRETIGGGSSFATTVNSGGLALVGRGGPGPMGNGGTAVGTVINVGGELQVGPRGQVEGPTVGFGGFLDMVSAGIYWASIDGATIESGGVMVANGFATDTMVESGGLLIVLPSAFVSGNSGPTISTGIVLRRGSGGVASFGATASGVAVGAGGELYVLPGGTASATDLASGGTLDVYAGGAAVGIVLGSGATANLESGAGGDGGIVFAGGDATLVLGGMAGSGLPIATISGFAATDTIDLASVPFSTAAATLHSGNLLEIDVDYSAPTILRLDPNQDFSGAQFSLAPTPSYGTSITIGPQSITACFRAGTRIATERGEVPVEALRVGDRARLAGGGAARVVWLGHRDIDCRRHPAPHDVWPVRVAAGAFARGRPRRDLFLSPDHAVFVAGGLIPIRYLVNGATILSVPADRVTYWHVELPAHGVLLADNLPCESYLDTGNRAAFGDCVGATGADAAARAIWATRGAAPLVLEGPALAGARCRLLARAAALGYRPTDEPALALVADGVRLPLARVGGLHAVRIPPGTREVRLRSRAWVPAHSRAEATDTRILGVALSHLWLDGRAASLDSPALAGGWHALERDARWTDGDASIAPRGARSLAFEVAMTGGYWSPDPSISLKTSIAALNPSRPAGTPA